MFMEFGSCIMMTNILGLKVVISAASDPLKLVTSIVTFNDT
jgi:hypothetical protein